MRVEPADEALDGRLTGATFFAIAGDGEALSNSSSICSKMMSFGRSDESHRCESVNDFALLIEHIVVLEQAFADRVILLLGPFSVRSRSSG